MNLSQIEEKIRRLKIDQRCFVGGKRVSFNSTLDRKSSIDGSLLPQLSNLSSVEVGEVVELAHENYLSQVWIKKEKKEKKEILLRLASLMEKNIDELALLDTLETGRCYKNYIEDSLPKAIDVVRWFAESADKYQDTLLPPEQGRLAYILREPIGVVACITPWNDPLVPAMWKLIPSLVMGNTVIMKPAEQSSLSLLRVADLAKEAGVPNGTLNVITGAGEVAGKALALHEKVAGVFFTGSSKVGKLLLQYSGQSNMKRVGLECGGKSPFVVTKNYENLTVVAETLAKNIFYNQGQICSAPSRAIVHADVFEELFEKVKALAAKYAPGHPFDPQVNVGCMISEQQKMRALRLIDSGISEGLNYYQAPDLERAPKNGQYINPIIFEDVPKSSELFQEEIFGPVLSFTRFKSLEEALNLANHSRYGLASSIWSNDVNEVHYFCQNLCAGTVHVNSYGEDDITAPFGGFKQSGIGKDKSLLALDEYSQSKTVWKKLSRIAQE